MCNKRYARQLILPEIGPDGQKRLAEASVLIVGLGGLGTPAATYLTGAGVGRIGLCDHDTVGLANLQRQTLYTEAEIGLPKTECARKRLSAMSAHTAFDTYPRGLLPENARGIIRRYDIVIDCCDNFATRYLIDDSCDAESKPWVYGSISEFGCQIAVMNGSKKLRYTSLFPCCDTLAAIPAASAGVLGTVPGVAGAIQANEAIKFLCGFGETLDGRLYTLDLKTLETNIFEF